MSNLGKRARLAAELTIDSTTLTGGWDTIGTLLQNPVHIVFDNQSDTEIQIGYNGVDTWHTFPAGEAILLDMRANSGVASNYTLDIGTVFYAMGTAGTTGNFSISYSYAE